MFDFHQCKMKNGCLYLDGEKVQLGTKKITEIESRLVVDSRTKIHELFYTFGMHS